MLSFFRKRLSVRRINDGYITIIYPVKDEGVVINDTLSGAFCESLQCKGPLAPLDVDPASSAEIEDWHLANFVYEFGTQPMLCINPASGLPMINDFVDVGGNVVGFSSDI
ncbi:hypothetical protein [Stutzerimonas xanthomarina]|uniref:hypothetical protein n=1 Tax=Stutzerimonas xanthomarina TaxID=271420 RepID=UPI003AA880C0